MRTFLNCNCSFCRRARQAPTTAPTPQPETAPMRNANTLTEQAVVTAAAAAGKAIEVSRRVDREEKWADATNPLFNFMSFRYRVKAEAKFVIVDRDGDLSGGPMSREDIDPVLADRRRRGAYAPYRLLQLVEVSA